MQQSAEVTTPLFQLGVDGTVTTVEIDDVKNLLREVGRAVQKRHPGIDIEKLGRRSIQSGAAMALFINGHHPERIKILGRWSSEAFLV